MMSTKDYTPFFEAMVGYGKPMQKRNYYYFVCVCDTKNTMVILVRIK